MRIALLPLAAAAAAIALAACQSTPRSSIETGASGAPVASTEPLTADSATLTVQGLGCPLCAHNLDKQLLEVPGVQRVSVDLGTGTAVVALSGDRRPSPADLAGAVERAGFTLVGVR